MGRREEQQSQRSGGHTGFSESTRNRSRIFIHEGFHDMLRRPTLEANPMDSLEEREFVESVPETEDMADISACQSPLEALSLQETNFDFPPSFWMTQKSSMSRRMKKNGEKKG